MRYGEAFALKQTAGKFAGFDMKAANAGLVRRHNERIQYRRGDAGPRRIRSAVQVIDVSVSLKVAIAQDLGIENRRYQGDPAVARAGVNPSRVRWSGRPGGDLLR